jgi:hypothetical protein
VPNSLSTVQSRKTTKQNMPPAKAGDTFVVRSLGIEPRTCGLRDHPKLCLPLSPPRFHGVAVPAKLFPIRPIVLSASQLCTRLSTRRTQTCKPDCRFVALFEVLDDRNCSRAAGESRRHPASTRQILIAFTLVNNQPTTAEVWKHSLGLILREK